MKTSTYPQMDAALLRVTNRLRMSRACGFVSCYLPILDELSRRKHLLNQSAGPRADQFVADTVAWLQGLADAPEADLARMVGRNACTLGGEHPGMQAVRAQGTAHMLAMAAQQAATPQPSAAQIVAAFLQRGITLSTGRHHDLLAAPKELLTE